MSVSSLTTIASVREGAARSERRESPKKGQIGKVPTGHADAGKDAGIIDVLAKQIPTELICALHGVDCGARRGGRQADREAPAP